ncbi:MAG: rhodanese-like domain-containing protein [Chloroflexota bacterium]
MGLFKKLFGKQPDPTPEPVVPPPPPPEPEPLHINEVTVGELAELLASDEAVTVVDLRQPWEYTSGHITGAINVPIMYLPDHLDHIPKDQKVIMQCYHGFTSLDASGFLLENGWADDNVFSLMGGMSEWVVQQGMGSLVSEE